MAYYRSIDINGGEQNQKTERLVIYFCNEAVYSCCERLHLFKVGFETINILRFYCVNFDKGTCIAIFSLSILISLYQLDDENKSFI